MRSITKIRGEIEETDAKIVLLLKRRVELGIEAGKVKRAKNMPVCVPEREEQVIKNVTALAEKINLSADFIRQLYKKIIGHTRKMEAEYCTAKHEKRL